MLFLYISYENISQTIDVFIFNNIYMTSILSRRLKKVFKSTNN